MLPDESVRLRSGLAQEAQAEQRIGHREARRKRALRFLRRRREGGRRGLHFA